MAFDLQKWLFGGTPDVRQATTQTPEQQQFQEQMLSQLGGTTGMGMEWLQQILSGDESAFADFEAPIKRQFEQEVVPGIAERFAGMGSGGAQSSSAMQQTMGRAGTELSQNLAQMRSGLKMGAMQQLQGLISQSQQPTFQNIYEPGSTGVLGGLIEGGGGDLLQSGMNYFLPSNKPNAQTPQMQPSTGTGSATFPARGY